MADIETSILIRILDAFTAPLRKLDSGLEDVEETAKQVEKRLKLAADLNQAAEGAGRFARMLAGPIKGSIMEFANFEAAMSKVSALTGQKKGSPLFEALKKQAVELGAETQYSAEEVAQLMQEYSQAGFKPEEIMKITPQTLSAATAAGMDLADTARIIGGTMNSMGIDVAQTGRTVDIMTKAASSSNSSLRTFGEAMSYVGPVARNAGMSLEMTSAMLGKLHDNMIEGSSAGTGLRATIAKLIDPSKEATRAFAKLGIGGAELKKLQDAVATGRLDEALRRIGQATQNLDKSGQLKVLSQIFGLDAAAAAQVLVRTSLDTSDKGLAALNRELHNLNDDTNEMAKVMQDNLLGSFERAKGAISGLATAAGEALAPTAKSAAEALEGISGWATDFVKQYPTFSKATLELTAGLSGLAFTMQGGMLALSTYQSAMAGLTKAYGTMSQSLGGQFGLIALAGAAGVLVGTWANQTLKLDEAIASLAGRKTPKAADAKSHVQTYAGGWEINMQTGEVVTMGKGEGPAIVRRARAKGARTKEELSGVIGMERKAVVNRPMAERVAEEEAKHMGIYSPLLEAPTKTRPKVLLPETPQESAAAKATNRQTELLLKELREAAVQQKKIADGMERLRFLQPGGMQPIVVR